MAYSVKYIIKKRGSLVHMYRKMHSYIQIKIHVHIAHHTYRVHVTFKKKIYIFIWIVPLLFVFVVFYILFYIFCCAHLHSNVVVDIVCCNIESCGIVCRISRRGRLFRVFHRWNKEGCGCCWSGCCFPFEFIQSFKSSDGIFSSFCCCFCPPFTSQFIGLSNTVTLCVE